MQSIVWLEDNPELISNEEKNIISDGYELHMWDGLTELGNGNTSSGSKCLTSFKASLEKFVDNADRLSGIILDTRIPVVNLSVLGMPDITTCNGLITGPQVGYYYLRNEAGNSPLGNKFKETPLLFFTITSSLSLDCPWIHADQKSQHLVKGLDTPDYLKKWVNSLD